MYVNAGEYIKGRGIEPVTRKELESIVYDSFPANQKPPMSPVHIHTMNRKVDQDYPFSLSFDWAEFFGGDNREYPRTSSWNKQLLKDSVQTRDWILEHRNTRQIRLTGSRRLSAMFAIGYVFSAVAGFSVAMNHRGLSWSTSDYPTVTTPSYPVKANFKQGTGDSIIISIGILRDIAEEVEKALITLDLDRSSILHIESTEEVVSPEHSNVATRKIKRVISKHLSAQDFKQAHIFYAGPSHLALFLAHRLNATVPIQCYEWVSTNTYLPTCSLN
jgi:hypothetical protein